MALLGQDPDPFRLRVHLHLLPHLQARRMEAVAGTEVVEMAVAEMAAVEETL
jgi:hypothetical protein